MLSNASQGAGFDFEVVCVHLVLVFRFLVFNFSIQVDLGLCLERVSSLLPFWEYLAVAQVWVGLYWIA